MEGSKEESCAAGNGGNSRSAARRLPTATRSISPSGLLSNFRRDERDSEVVYSRVLDYGVP